MLTSNSEENLTMSGNSPRVVELRVSNKKAYVWDVDGKQISLGGCHKRHATVLNVG